jgi:hypothetical protein
MADPEDFLQQSKRLRRAKFFRSYCVPADSSSQLMPLAATPRCRNFDLSLSLEAPHCISVFCARSGRDLFLSFGP